jgi:hypothetical protein
MFEANTICAARRSAFGILEFPVTCECQKLALVVYRRIKLERHKLNFGLRRAGQSDAASADVQTRREVTGDRPCASNPFWRPVDAAKPGRERRPGFA